MTLVDLVDQLLQKMSLYFTKWFDLVIKKFNHTLLLSKPGKKSKQTYD